MSNEGPWHIEKSKDGMGFLHITDKNQDICMITSDEPETTAQLIHALPELYEACKWVADLEDGKIYFDQKYPFMKPLIDNCVKAIKRAEGKN